ncbi:hypothetical protein HPULCUR_008514 [Helicostylum pulchrum]|uniref:BSD domain-containing protein n=1 Tax=Helicostylum pulchrum TaxID=562976 RepID=A0ABP9Y7U1_9FUNG
MTDDSNSSTNKGGFFGSSFFSNVTSSVTALSQTIQTKGLPEMNKRLNELQQKAREIPGHIAILQGDLEHERTSFIQKNKNAEDGAHRPKAKGSEPVAPWIGYNGYEKEMKEAIMNISKDERNFLISPPEDTSFQFDLNAYSQSAQAALKEDQVLSKMRFTLVPQQVQEPTFWRNYFYRVTIAKQNVLSHPPTEQEVKEDDTVLFNFQEDIDEGSDEESDDEKDEQKDEQKVEQKGKQKEEQNVEKKVETKIEKKTENDEKKDEKKDEDFEGMEDWEIELRKAAIL